MISDIRIESRSPLKFLKTNLQKNIRLSRARHISNQNQRSILKASSFELPNQKRTMSLDKISDRSV